MNTQSFIDVINALEIRPTGKLGVRNDLPMNLMLELDVSSEMRPDKFTRQFEIMVRFGQRLFFDQSMMDDEYIATRLNDTKRSMKLVAFSDSLDFIQKVIDIAMKNGNRELFELALKFQSRIMDSHCK